MSRREELLREMGLAPVWVLRERGGEPVHGPATAPQGTDRLPSEPDKARPPERAPTPGAPATPDDRAARIARMEWPELKAAVADCKACGLCKTRKNAVFGVGDESAEWMIVGEAPGAEEDERGEPFVGQAGKLLDSMLASIGLSRRASGKDSVYIANVLKCRPPGNRNPEPQEVAQCSPHLVRQIELVKPKIVLAMGRFAAQTLLASDASIGSMRGKEFRYQGVPTVVTYHPAYLLRNLPDKAKSWEDLCFARQVYGS